MGRMTTSSDFMGNIQRFTYDALGRLTRHAVPFERIGNTTHYRVTYYTHDSNGNTTRIRTSTNLPGAAATWSDTNNTFTYNRLTHTQTGNGPITEYTYDLAGNILTKTVGGAVGATASATTTYTYNNRGQLTRITSPLGQREDFTYDTNGLLLTRTDPNGTTFRNTYDNMGRLIRQEALRGTVVQGHRAYTFTTTGAIHTITNGAHTITNTYDAQGRLIRQDET